MKQYKLILLLSFTLMGVVACTGSNTPEWRSYSGDKTIESRVDSLVALMTLEEKIGQLNQYSGGFAVTGQIANNESGEYLKMGMIGSTFNVFGAAHLRMLQEQTLKYSRLKIPMLFAGDVIHGLKTTFPIPLAEACSWDLQMMERSARIAAEEATAMGVCWNFAPMVDIARDPRWGRVMEGAGEDVYLGSLVAAARTRGFQGIADWKDFSKNNTMMACAKHFVGYGAAQAGRDYHSVDMSDRTLRNTYLLPFQAAVDAGVASFMTAFNDLNGTPCTANKYLFKDILRDEWDFKGMVVTDYTAINEMIEHGYSRDLKHAAEQAMNAGIDMDMIGEGFVKHLKTLIEEGKVSENQIDVAVSRVLEMKFLLGLFDDPYRYFDEERERKIVMNPAFLQEALLNAQRSIVLLKNQNQILPLRSSQAQEIAVIGPFADERKSLNGEWAILGDRNLSVTLEEGLRDRFKDSKLTFSKAKGCSLLPDNDQSGFAKAIQVAKNSDVIVAAMGEDYNWSGEAASRTTIQLPGEQQKLLKELKKLGKPIVLILFNGRPLDLSWEDANMDAIVEAWFPGIQAGNAVADVLAGNYNPSAKLVMTFPRSVGQIPIFYNMKNTGRPYDEKNPSDYRSSYMDSPNTPLYPFGYGLSYSKFEYSNLKLSDNTFSAGGEIVATVDIKNSGDFDGEEIVQLYLRDKVGSVTLPVKELKGFKKILLKAGETKKISFTVNEETIKIFDRNREWKAEAGEFDLWVAASSADVSTHATFVFE